MHHTKAERDYVPKRMNTCCSISGEGIVLPIRDGQFLGLITMGGAVTSRCADMPTCRLQTSAGTSHVVIWGRWCIFVYTSLYACGMQCHFPPPNDAKYKLLLMLMLLLDDDADADAAAGRVLGIPYSTPCPTPTRMKYP